MQKLEEGITNIVCIGLVPSTIAACAGSETRPVRAIPPNNDLLTFNTVDVKGVMSKSNQNQGKTAAAGVIGAVMFFQRYFYRCKKR